MKMTIKKLFGGLNLTWPKLIIAAVIAGVFTAVMAIIPALHYTSFHTISVYPAQAGRNVIEIRAHHKWAPFEQE